VVNVQTGGGRIVQGNLQSPNVPRLTKVLNIKLYDRKIVKLKEGENGKIAAISQDA